MDLSICYTLAIKGFDLLFFSGEWLSVHCTLIPETLFTVMPSQSASWLHSVVSLLNLNVLDFLALSVGDCNLSVVLSTHLDSVV